jgi:hypothetical protein
MKRADIARSWDQQMPPLFYARFGTNPMKCAVLCPFLALTRWNALLYSPFWDELDEMGYFVPVSGINPMKCAALCPFLESTQ